MSSSTKTAMPGESASTGQETSLPKGFKIKKYLLMLTVALCALDNLVAVLSLDTMSQAVVLVLGQGNVEQEKLDSLKPLVRHFILGVLVLAVAVDLLFMFAVFMQNIPLCTVYVALTMVYAACAALGLLLHCNGVMRLVESIWIAILAIFYLIDLRNIQDSQMGHFA